MNRQTHCLGRAMMSPTEDRSLKSSTDSDIAVVNLNIPRAAVDTHSEPRDKLPRDAELLELPDYAPCSFKWREGALPDGQRIQAVN